MKMSNTKGQGLLLIGWCKKADIKTIINSTKLHLSNHSSCENVIKKCLIRWRGCLEGMMTSKGNIVGEKIYNQKSMRLLTLY